MDPREVFQRYRAERRHQPYTGMTLERLPHLSRYVANIDGVAGFVAFADLPPDDCATSIDEQVAHFQRIGQTFEWKVYDFDSPPTLKSLLEERGFRAGDEEAFLVLDSTLWEAPTRELGAVRIEKITDVRQLPGFIAAEQAIWPEDRSSRLEKYTREISEDPSGISIYCGYVDDQPIATGRVSFFTGSAFAELNGGGVVSEMRGQGVFSAMLSRRIEEARSRGFRWVAVDAAPMSRPILLRKGFQHICWTYPMLHEM